MSSPRKPVVVSLNYHEVTRDPRVMKQARALADAGYDMHVVCHRADGAPQSEVIDGIAIRRFPAFDPRHLGPDWIGRYGFMKGSIAGIRDRIDPLVADLEAIRAAQGGEVPDHLLRFHYIQARGAERRRRKSKRIAALSALALRGLTSSKHRKAWLAALSVERLRARLYQAESILFAEGLCRHIGFEQVDVVHAHDIYTLPAGVLLAQRTGARLVYDAHEYEPARATKMDATARTLPELIENDCFPHVSALITVSQSIAELYAERFGGKIEIVYNAPEMAFDVTPDASKDVRRTLALPADAPTVVFTGGIQGPHRGVDRVVAALEHLPGCHLVLMGPRDAGSDRWVTNLARRHGVADRIVLVPPVDARDVPAAISGMGVAICPFQDVSLNHRFAMPNKLFEAAFAGIPICVSDLPEMRRFVEGMGIGVTMDQTDPVAIAAAIRTVLQDRPRYLLTEERRQKLQKTYGWPAQVETLLGVYDSLGMSTGAGRAADRRGAQRRMSE